jgi:hypothetical protein
MPTKHFQRLLAATVLLMGAALAQAGMPAPLPTEAPRVLRWRSDDTILQRLQAISFFAVVLLVCAAAVQGLWNLVRRDFPRLPRLSFGRALAGVLLWGLLFIVVLAMVAGARELMTPGAWHKEGWTYRLNSSDSGKAEPSLDELHRQHLEKLRTALWHFAATHGGRFPSSKEKPLIPAELWRVPDGGGLQYIYLSNESASEAGVPLAYEPELDSTRRLVLYTNGDIASMTSAQFAALVKKEPAQ